MKVFTAKHCKRKHIYMPRFFQFGLTSRLIHFPMSAGMLPLNLLPATTKVTRPVSLPRPKGIDPESPKSEILIPIMRFSPSKIPHCTPSHPHGEEELSDNHCCNLLLAVPFRTVDAQVLRAVWSALSHTPDSEDTDCKPIYQKKEKILNKVRKAN